MALRPVVPKKKEQKPELPSPKSKTVGTKQKQATQDGTAPKKAKLSDWHAEFANSVEGTSGEANLMNEQCIVIEFLQGLYDKVAEDAALEESIGVATRLVPGLYMMVKTHIDGSPIFRQESNPDGDNSQELFFYKDCMPLEVGENEAPQFVASGWYVTNKFVWDIKKTLESDKAKEKGLEVYLYVENPPNMYAYPVKAAIPYWASHRNKHGNNKEFVVIEGFQQYANRKAVEAKAKAEAAESDAAQTITSLEDRVTFLQDSIDSYAEAVTKDGPWEATEEEVVDESDTGGSPTKKGSSGDQNKDKQRKSGGGWMSKAINLLTAILQNNSGKSWDLAIKYTHGSKDVFWAVRGCLCSGFFLLFTYPYSES